MHIKCYIKISHLAIDSTESLEHDQKYDQQAKDTLFRKYYIDF